MRNLDETHDWWLRACGREGFRERTGGVMIDWNADGQGERERGRN